MFAWKSQQSLSVLDGLRKSEITTNLLDYLQAGNEEKFELNSPSRWTHKQIELNLAPRGYLSLCASREA